jgi:hypothetical protein
VVSLEVAGVVRGEWATPDSGFTAATNDVLLRVVALDADGTATELNERLRIWKNPGGIQSARIGCDVLTAGTFSVDPIIGSVFLEFNAAGTTVTPPPDPAPGDGVTSGSDTYPVARGLLAWHICDHGTFVTNTTFEDVTQLDDLSGNANHLTSSGGTAPTRIQTNTVVPIPDLNGRKPVSFKDGYLQWPTSLFTGVTAAELFVVVAGFQTDPTTDRKYNWIMGPHSGPDNQPQWAAGSGATDSGHIVEDFGSSVLRDLGDAPGSLLDWHVFNVRAGDAQWVAALDGSILLSTGTNTVSFATAPRMGSVSENSLILVAEIAIHDAILTTDERALVLAALQARWGL